MTEEMREFDDAKATRKNIYDNVLTAMQKRFPVEDDNYKLELLDVRYDGPQEFSLSQQKNALLRNRNLRTNLVGRWRLTDKRTGKVLDEREDSVMQVPYWTDRGTIINNGSEYTVISQSRLRPGVYARRKANGEFETQFNIRPGTGRAFHLGISPETGVMTLQTGQGSLPLYQVLRGLGASDKDIVRFWGADIAKANAEKQDAQAWSKLYSRMAGYRANPAASEEEKQQFVREALSKYEVDPEVVERTMGLRNVSSVTPELLLRASQKMLNVMRGDEQPDNRDSPRFSKFYGVEDYFKERIEKNAGRLANTLLFKARRSGNLKGVRRNALNPWVDTIINGSGLAMPGEEANPLSTLEQMSRISKFGLGGIGSPEAVTMEARDVQGDYLGFVDQNSGPECFPPDTMVMTSGGWVRFDEVTEDTEFLCWDFDRHEKRLAKPERIVCEDYSGDMLAFQVGYPTVIWKGDTKTEYPCEIVVTPGHRLWLSTGEGQEFGFVKASEAFRRLEAGEHFSVTSEESPEDTQPFLSEPLTGVSRRPYSGKVYCATVPGGLMFVAPPNCSAHWTGNSERAGTDVRASYRTFLGKDNKLYGEFIDNRTGKLTKVDIATAADRLVAFPGQDMKQPYVLAMKDGIPQRVKADEVRYTLPSYAHMLVPNTNMNPMPTGVQSTRQFYGSKFWSQYLPQAHGEVPLVDSLMPDGKTTWSEYYGRKVGTLKSDVDGIVVKVNDDEVVVKDDLGKLHKVELTRNFPFNRLSALSHYPAVEVGQRVKAGDMVAHSNYTDRKTGAINMGQNLKAAILPWRGWSVSGDTNVLWRDGNGNVSYGPIRDVRPGSGMESLTVDPDTLESFFAPCNAWMIHTPDTKMYLVETEDGRTVKATGSHSMMVYDGKSGMREVRTDELVPGTHLIPVVRPVLPFGTVSGTVECRTDRGIGRSTRVFDIDGDFGWFVGIFLAEGSVTYVRGIPHNLSIAAVEPEIVDRVIRFCDRYNIGYRVLRSSIPSKVDPSKLNTHGSVIVYSAGLASWLAENCGRYAWFKKLPSLAFTAPVEFARRLVDGYMCGDGCVTKECTFSTTSGLLADGMCLLLGGLGVRATYRKYSPRAGRHTQHLVHVFRDTIANFPSISLKRKNEALDALRSSRVRFSRDRIPIPDGVKFRSVHYPYVGREAARRLAEESGEDRMLKLSNAGIWWDVVKSVTEIPEEEYVYDLDMQPTGTFVVGTGIVVHNSYEDAYTISEDAAKRLATDRLYSVDHDARNGVVLDKKRYVSAFPSKFTKEQFETLDDDGIVKPGTVLHRGDPIVVSIGPKLLTSSDKVLGKLSKALRNSFVDKSETWEHDYPGTVVDAVRTSSGAKVNVSAQPPVRVGDKLCYDPETEVLTLSGWKRISDVSLDDNVATLDPDTGKFEYIKPELVHSYEHHGRMYRLVSQQLDVMVTPNHNMYVQKRGHGEFGLYRADEITGKRVSYKKDGEWVGDEPEFFTFPAMFVGHRWGTVLRPEIRMGMEPFLALLGMYLSEGSCINDARSSTYGIYISQKKRSGISEGNEALRKYGIKASAHSRGWSIYGAHYLEYFRQFGHAQDKYIPEFVFGLSKRLQRVLLHWLMWGDGYSKNGRYVCYTTVSRRLSDDVQRLCLHCGYAANVVHGRQKAGSSDWCEDHLLVRKYDVHDVRIIMDKLTPTVNHSHVRSQHAQSEGFVEYDGMVYCCTMPKWNVIYVRRNGKPYWCGNSPTAGLKGVVGSIIPSDRMPRDAVTNQPYEVLINPMGFLSRVAPNQLIEMNLAKVAKATGRQVRIPQLPPPEGWYAWAKAQMDAAGVKEAADVFDPDSGKTIRNVGDGYIYLHAFHHLAEKKVSARGADGAYTQDEQPAKGGEEGAKRSSTMDLWSMLAHNVPEVIKDTQLVRGTMNQDYWRALQLGLPIPEPEIPFIYKKFLNTLRAGGVNVTEKGSITKIMPQTDRDVDALAGNRVITSSEMVDSDFEPMKGGLFDLGRTGGMAGNQWSMIKLPEPVPNPVMEEPVRRVLGLTTARMERILSGQEKLDGKTGGQALKDALAKVDVDRRLRECMDNITSKKGAARDDAVKQYRYLSAMKKQGLSPQDWMISKVPVIPPVFRPVSKMGDVALVSDLNELYKDVIENARNFEELRKDVDDDGLVDERLNIYNSVKAAYGLGQPITPENAAKGVKGALRQIVGSRPKWGMFQAKVLSKPVGGVSRGVISPDPNLDMDQCGIPEKMAWSMYKPYVMRALVQHGYPTTTAIKMIEDRTDTARSLLEKEMTKRPVILDRAPTWHKFNFLAFTPHLTDGNTIRVSPLITAGFTADFDGDQMNAHVPSSDKAVRQALEKMLPSKNLTSLTDLRSPRHMPSKEQIFGLYGLTRPMARKPVKVYSTVAEAKMAYQRGEIGPNDPIEILEAKK